MLNEEALKNKTVIENLNKELEQSKESLKSKENEAKSLNAKLLQIQSTATQLTEAKNKAELELAKLQGLTKMSESLRADKVTLEAKMLEMSENINQLTADKARVEAEALAKNQAIDGLENNVEYLQNQSDGIRRQFEREYAAKYAEMNTSYEQEVADMNIRLATDYQARLDAEAGKAFFEEKWFAQLVLFAVYSITGYGISSFIYSTFPDMPVWWAGIGAIAFQFVGIMITVHIGWSEKWQDNPLFWFEALCFTIVMFVLIPKAWYADTQSEDVYFHIGRCVAYLLFGFMWALAGYYYGLIYMRLRASTKINLASLIK